MTPAQAAQLVAELFSAFPLVRPSMETVTIYERRLLPCDYEAARVAIDRLIDRAEKLPAIADIKNAISDELRYAKPKLVSRGGGNSSGG